MKAPDVIYLQWHGDAPTTYFDDDDNEVPIPEEEMEDADPYGATWCADRIYDADIPYRRVTTCVWIQSLHGNWLAGCGATFDLRGDLPGAGWFCDCPYCGGRIEVKT